MSDDCDYHEIFLEAAAKAATNLFKLEPCLCAKQYTIPFERSWQPTAGLSLHTVGDLKATFEACFTIDILAAKAAATLTLHGQVDAILQVILQACNCARTYIDLSRSYMRPYQYR